MITDSDVKKLKKVFTTKTDLKKELGAYATKNDLHDSLRSMTDELVDLIRISHRETVREIVGEIKNMREELSGIVTNHGERIGSLEEKVYA